MVKPTVDFSADLQRALMVLEAILPAASYGASVAEGVAKPGYSVMARALKGARSVLADLRPGALVCRQSDHAYTSRDGDLCSRCAGGRPPEGPFTWLVEDVASDKSQSGAAATEKGAKNACSRAVERVGGVLPRSGLRAGLYANMVAPDGRRWEIDPAWQGGCSWWRELPALVGGAEHV